MGQKSLEVELENLHEQSFGWALRCCFDEKETAAEVLQTTYLKILEGKARYTGTAAFKTWLFSVIRFTAIDHYRSKARKTRFQIWPLSASPALMDENKAESEARDQRSQLFQKGLSQLSPKQSRVLHLVFYQNCSIREAAEIMDIQLGTARTHYERGKRQLKDWLTTVGFLNDVY